jgi:hypothetical protein
LSNPPEESIMKSALTVMSVMLLTAAISSAALVRMDSAAPGQVASFIGTTPDATVVEEQAPTF